MLLLAEDCWFMAAADDSGTALVDIKAGTTIRRLKEPIRVVVRAWRIFQKGLGDE
jgi:hypothetical protein